MLISPLRPEALAGDNQVASRRYAEPILAAYLGPRHSADAERIKILVYMYNQHFTGIKDIKSDTQRQSSVET